MKVTCSRMNSKMVLTWRKCRCIEQRYRAKGGEEAGNGKTDSGRDDDVYVIKMFQLT